MTGAPDIRSLVYGPVPSRRLGRSLGVDLVPFKTCTYDCVYCQLGPTTHKTATRERWVEPERVLDQVRGRLDSRPDVIALAGSGEPTLYAGLGEVIDGIKAMSDVPLVVITNGSLLGRPDVQRDLAGADIVLPSLDAVDDASYRAVNRPHEDLGFDELVDGMAAFRASFSGEIWLEVMLLDGVTGTGPMVEKLARHADRIAPDRIQLNTVVRPPAEQDARPVSPEMLEHFADCVHAAGGGDRRSARARSGPGGDGRRRAHPHLAAAVHGGGRGRRAGDPPEHGAQGAQRARRAR